MCVPPTPTPGRPSAQMQRVQPSNSLKLSLQGSLSCRKPPHPGPSFPEVAQREGATGVYMPTYLTQSRPALTSHLAQAPHGVGSLRLWSELHCGSTSSALLLLLAPSPADFPKNIPQDDISEPASWKTSLRSVGASLTA